jgi:hypothetical protein
MGVFFCCGFEIMEKTTSFLQISFSAVLYVKNTQKVQKTAKKQPKNSHLLCLFVRRPGSDAASILEFIAKNGKKWLKNG